MAITFQNLGASANPDINNNADLSSYANSSWTPPTSGLILVFVASRAASGDTNVPTISGNSLTWTQIATVNFSAAHTMTLFGANASGSSAGATTIDFGGQTQQACRASFFLAEGVDLSGGVAAAFVQAPTNSGQGTDNGSVTLSAAGAADNRPVAAFAHSANEVKEPRANWTELDDLTGSFGGSSPATQYRDDAFETTASATWATSSTITWLGIAAEIKASGGAATQSQSAYRWRNDDGDEAAATWRRTENTKDLIQVNKNIRLRAQVNATGDPASAQYRLDFRRLAMTLLNDDFNDESTDTGRWTKESYLDGATNQSVTVVETGGTVTITPLSNTAGINYNGYASIGRFDFTGASIVYELIEDIPLDAINEMGVFVSSDDSLHFDVENGQIYFVIREGGDPGNYTNIAYSDTQHRWMRLRHDAGTDEIVWDTSPDNSAWTERRRVARPFAITNMGITVQGGTFQSRASPGQMVFDNVDLSLPITDWTAVGASQLIQLATSSYIATSGENTTAQLTAPATKTTSDFSAGRIQDDENPADAVDIPTDDYTELEWCIKISEGGIYDLRITIGGTVLDSYPQSPSIVAFEGSPANLRVYWKLEEGSAATTFIEEILGQDATLSSGDLSQVTGIVGNAQNNTGDPVVEAASHTDFDFQVSVGFSASVWMRTSNIDPEAHRLFSRDRNDIDRNVYYFTHSFNDGQIGFGVAADDGQQIQMFQGTGGYPNPGDLRDGDWHFIVGVMTPTHALLWIDGVLVAVKSGTHFTNDNITGAGASNMRLFNGRPNHASPFHFIGDLDEIALWEGVLTEEQIIQLYNSGNGIDYRNIFGHPGLRKAPRPLSVSLPIRQLQL